MPQGSFTSETTIEVVEGADMTVPLDVNIVDEDGVVTGQYDFTTVDDIQFVVKNSRWDSDASALFTYNDDTPGQGVEAVAGTPGRVLVHFVDTDIDSPGSFFYKLVTITSGERDIPMAGPLVVKDV